MNFSKAHFIGIAGKGHERHRASARQMGVQITGSDEGFYPPVSDYLKNEKIPFAEGYRKENIPDDADVIVIGKNAKLPPDSNEEVRAAMDSGKPVRSFADLLHDMTAASETIVAAGSYGKSTCTALLAWCLKSAKKDPSYFIGEITNGFESHAHRGQGPTFVLEGDEYPSSNWDNTSKFLRYNARNVLLTSATHDHVNVFPRTRTISRRFAHCSARCRGRASGRKQQRAPRTRAGRRPGLRHGLLFAGRQGALARRQYRTRRGDRFRPDARPREDRSPVDQNARRSQHRKHRRCQRDAARKEAAVAGRVERRHEHVQGREAPHGIALAASAVPVYEGFGSSYEKARSAIAATKLHFPDRRLIVVFEPHTFTWRNRARHRRLRRRVRRSVKDIHLRAGIAGRRHAMRN